MSIDDGERNWQREGDRTRRGETESTTPPWTLSHGSILVRTHRFDFPLHRDSETGI